MPMDLGTISKKLRSNAYRSSKECLDDLFMMFKNCYIYNAPGEDVVKMAQYLEAIARQKLEEMPQVEIELPPIANLKRNHNSLTKREMQRRESEDNLNMLNVRGTTSGNTLDLQAKIKLMLENHQNLIKSVNSAVDTSNELSVKIAMIKSYLSRRKGLPK